MGHHQHLLKKPSQLLLSPSSYFLKTVALTSRSRDSHHPQDPRISPDHNPPSLADSPASKLSLPPVPFFFPLSLFSFCSIFFLSLSFIKKGKKQPSRPRLHAPRGSHLPGFEPKFHFHSPSPSPFPNPNPSLNPLNPSNPFTTPPHSPNKQGQNRSQQPDALPSLSRAQRGTAMAEVRETREGKARGGLAGIYGMFVVAGGSGGVGLVGKRASLESCWPVGLEKGLGVAARSWGRRGGEVDLVGCVWL